MLAKTVHVTLHVKEATTIIDYQGTKYRSWIFGGTMPGPLVHVRLGDVVDFKLVNDAKNEFQHSIDFHASTVDVLDEFAPTGPGESKHFRFRTRYPGVFMYHCGAAPMIQHIACGMYGAVIVDPVKYTKHYPRPDREYVLVQRNYVPDPDDVDAMVNSPVAFHPIAGIWDRVYPSGNPGNVMYGVQTYNVAVAEAVTFDIVSPKGHATNNAIVDHTMRAALHGAITVLMNKPDADPKLGKGDNIIIR